MAGIKISQLDSGGEVTSTDQLPVARDGSTTYRIPASQFVVNGSNAGTGSAQIFADKVSGAGTTLRFRSLAAEEGLSLRTSGDTIFISASGQNPSKTAFVGNGTTTTWAINDAKSVNPNNYRVTIDGVVQEPNVDYTINLTNSTITFTSAPPNNSGVVLVSNNLVRVFDTVPSDGSVTSNKLALSAVTTPTINTNAVTTEKINNSAVTNAKIAFDGGSFCFRNKIINGDMRIDQRNAGAAVTLPANSVLYSVDRTIGYQTGSTVTHQQLALTDASMVGQYCQKKLRITGNTGNTGFQYAQKLEGDTGASLGGLNAVTLSFYAASNTITSLAAIIHCNTSGTVDLWNSNSYNIAGLATNTTFTINSTMSRYSVTFAMPVLAANGVQVTIGNIPLGSGQFVDITGVQLESGPVATPFEYRPIGVELAMCQRYFEIVQGTAVATKSSFTVNPYKVTKRIFNPVITLRSGSFSGADILSWNADAFRCPNGTTSTGGATDWFVNINAEL